MNKRPNPSGASFACHFNRRIGLQSAVIVIISFFIAGAPVAKASPPPTPTPPCSTFQPTFNNIGTLIPNGWMMLNNSEAGPGLTGWFQGSTAVFSDNGPYIAANYNNGIGLSTLSDWLLTPPLLLQDGAVITFSTRAVPGAFPDRLQLRMSTNGAGSNVGATATSVGDFTNLLLDVNSTYVAGGYPFFWTSFTETINGLGSPTVGRLAFRYFVENGGPNGPRSNYIGIYFFQVVGLGCPTPTPTVAPSGCGLRENFDGVSVPALPIGWSAVNSVNPDSIFWVTSSSAPDTPPNDAMINDPGTVSDKRLETPLIVAGSVGASFVFRTNYSFDPGSGTTEASDGGVLEISSPNINGGAFTDITDPAVGGNFIAGGYNGTISTAFGSPIGGRMAWTGNSGGYRDVGIQLGSRIANRAIRLRFRMCSDSSGSGIGWHVDNFVVAMGCESLPPPAPTRPPGTPAPTPSNGGISGSISYCSNPSGGPVASATLSLLGSSAGIAMSNGSGEYTFSFLTTGGTYTVTPAKNALSPGSTGITTADVLAVQRHFLSIVDLTGCQLNGADVNSDGSVTTLDVIAIQRFFLGLTGGVANVGKYNFNPASRSYDPLTVNQVAQTYDGWVLGDVAPPFVEP